MKTATVTSIIIALIIGISAAAFYLSGQELETYENFTACLHEKNVVMFGASWCPHCAEQKALFERGAKTIPYFECSPNGSASPQDEQCAIRNVSAYPTWQFDDAYLATLPANTWDTYAAAYDAQASEENKVELLSNFEKFTSLEIDGRKVYNEGRFSR